MQKLFFILLFSVFALPTFALETIKDFHSDIRVQTDGSVIVTEKITVNREGKQIRRGIYRDLLKTKGVRYSVISVKRDGEKEPFFTENAGRFYRINTGNDNFLPRNGLYTFEITYRASNVVLGFENYDEIYWNVTGNEWNFPIERVSAKVILPQGAKEIQHAGYTGSTGSKTPSNYNLDTGVFSALYLNKGEGLTVAVGFDKGFVDVTRAPAFPIEKGVEYAALILGGYMLVTWYLYGRDPEKDAIVPRYRGLPDLTPAQAGWIYAYGHNAPDCVSAAFLQSGISGFLKLEDTGADTLRISKQRTAQTGEEKTIDHNLNIPITLTKKYNPSMKIFMKTFETFLENKTGEKYFTQNTLWLVLGCLLTAALTAGLCFLADEPHLALIMGFYLIFFVSFGKKIVATLSTGKFSFSAFFGLIFVSIHFCGMTLGAASEMPDAAHTLPFYLLSCLALMVYSFLIIRPTYEGMQVIAHLDGIKMFLKAVEPTLPKEVDFNKMESLLPYAVLFGLEKEWEEKMKIVSAGSAYRPEWYSGHRFSSHSLNTFHSVVSTSCTPPSRSGSGGGGFSGGGFGGGGGGGR